MKRLTLLATTALFAGVTHAAEIRNVITDSVQLKAVPTVTITTPTSATYSVSGTNISAASLGGVGGAGTYSVTNDGQAFSFSESAAAAGVETQVQTGGTAGSLAGTLSNTGVGTVTAGGPGTDGILQRSIELTVFQ